MELTSKKKERKNKNNSKIQDDLNKKLGGAMPTFKEIEDSQGSYAKLLNNRLRKR